MWFFTSIQYDYSTCPKILAHLNFCINARQCVGHYTKFCMCHKILKSFTNKTDLAITSTYLGNVYEIASTFSLIFHSRYGPKSIFVGNFSNPYFITLGL
jgi:hypothetical protein